MGALVCNCLWRPEDNIANHCRGVVCPVFGDRVFHWCGTDWLPRLTVQWRPSIRISLLLQRTIAQLFYVGPGWSYLCPHIHEATTYKLGYPRCLASVHTICNGFFIFFKPSRNVLCLEPVPHSIGTLKRAMENFWGPCFTLVLIPTTSNKRTFIPRQTTHGKIRCPVNCKQIFPACNQKLNLN